MQFSILEPADVLYVHKGPVATEMGCGWLNTGSEKHSGSNSLPNLAFLPKSFTKLWLQFVWLAYRLSSDTNVFTCDFVQCVNMGTGKCEMVCIIQPNWVVYCFQDRSISLREQNMCVFLSVSCAWYAVQGKLPEGLHALQDPAWLSFGWLSKRTGPVEPCWSQQHVARLHVH